MHTNADADSDTDGCAYMHILDVLFASIFRCESFFMRVDAGWDRILDLDVLLRIGNGDLPSSLLGYRLSRRFCAAVEWVWVRWRGCASGGTQRSERKTKQNIIPTTTRMTLSDRNSASLQFASHSHSFTHTPPGNVTGTRWDARTHDGGAVGTANFHYGM